LSPEAVAEHQRERVVVGVAMILAERGYGGLTVENVITAARISRTTFYDLFANKQEAVLFAQETVFKRFFIAIRRACEEEDEWPRKVGAAIETTLAFAEALPAQAQLLAAQFLSGDPILAARARSSHDRLASLLRGGRHHPEGASLPGVTERALVGAIATILVRHLVKEETRPAALRDQLIQFTLIPYIGRPEAERAVATEGA
jgi:AcrR family transcriptional regulator